MMWTELLADAAAPSRMEILAWCVMPTVLGLITYFFLSRKDPSEILYKARFVAFLPPLVGIWQGAILSYRMMTDYLYQQINLIGTSMQMLHYACLIIPILGCLGIAAWSFAQSRTTKYDF